MSYFLDDYRLNGFQILQSCFVSEYGLRHLRKARTAKTRFGHIFIAVVELCPLIGLIVSIAEALFRALYKLCFPLLIFKGTQLECNGRVSLKKAEKIVKLLQEKQSAGITFNPLKLEQRLIGGTCTAMAFSFFEKYCLIKQKTAGNPESEKILKKLRKLENYFSSSSVAMRIQQAAFNTIEVSKREEISTETCQAFDPSREKIQSLLNWHSYTIDFASREFDSTSDTVLEIWQQEIQTLPDGMYVLRTIETADNEKLEVHGHTMGYIKEHGLELFYDPNIGLKNLEEADADFLSSTIRDGYTSFGNNRARFYRITKN